MKISFVGLGDMGLGMAQNLEKNGCDLLVSNKSGSHFELFKKSSVECKEVAKNDVIFLCLPNSDAVANYIDSISPYLHEGQIIVDCSTISYETTLKVSEKLSKKEVEFLDAPISGQHEKAVNGTLTFMVGGKEDIYNKVLPLFNMMGTHIIYMGKTGNGQLTKMINNSLYDINCVAFSEMMPFAQKLGLEPEKIASVVNSSTGSSYASNFFLPKILENDFRGFSLNKAFKDLIHAEEAGKINNIKTPLLLLAKSIYEDAMKKSGDENKGSIIKLYEDEFGVKFRKN